MKGANFIFNHLFIYMYLILYIRPLDLLHVMMHGAKCYMFNFIDESDSRGLS